MKSASLPNRERWPLQLDEHGGGWSITYYGADGHARHVAHADSEIEAYRTAHNLAHLYRVEGKALVHSRRNGRFLIDVEKLMHRHR